MTTLARPSDLASVDRSLAPGDRVPRDQWGRPLISDPDDPDAPRRSYTRASTLSGSLSNKNALTNWKLRMAAVGLSRRADLIAKVQAKADDKSVLDKVAEEAIEYAGGKTAANLGTAFHAFADIVDDGRPLPEGVSQEMADLIGSYQEATAEWYVIKAEGFVVQDDLWVAGSYDRIVEIDGQCYISDLKTGKDKWKYAHSTAIQTAVYARGTEYDPETATRSGTLVDLYGVSLDRAVLLHMDQEARTVKPYWLDIQRGWSMARIASLVREWHRDNPVIWEPIG